MYTLQQVENAPAGSIVQLYLGAGWSTTEDRFHELTKSEDHGWYYTDGPYTTNRDHRYDPTNVTRYLNDSSFTRTELIPANNIIENLESYVHRG